MAKVLLIEDDPLISRMYLKVFGFEGFDIQLAENGQLGLDKLKEFHADILLVDVMMPVMNGVEMLAELKLDPATRDIPVIMLTNLADTRTAEATLKQGALKYIVKGDYNPLDIANMVKEVLSGKEAETTVGNNG
jgi:DNA-binding response OmpR family regulator